jgi:hypothetical protein
MEMHDRLLRIEATLDKLTDQLGELGRIDERTDAAHARISRHEVRIDWIEKEHRELAELFHLRSGNTQMWERLLWLGFAAAFAALVQWIR